MERKRVWSNNSSVQFHAVILAWFSGSCAVKLSSCHGKSCWLVSLDKSMRPCIKNWSSCWKKTMCIACSWNGIHHTGGCRMLSARFSPKRANPSLSCWRTSSPWSNPRPCSNGIANWSPRNGTFPAAGTPNRVGRPSQLRLNNWWCIARGNPGWGYDRIVGALANLGYHISDQTVGNILQRQGLGPAPERKRHTTWAAFIRRHTAVLWATDFFTAEVWTPTGLTTYYVLFFLHLQTRRVILAGITPFPNEAWLKQIARNVTAADGPMANARFLLHDRDAKFSENFDSVFHAAGIEALKLPPQSPNLNAFAERWVRSVKEECLDQLILFGERSLRHVLDEYLAHHQHERNHQGLDNVIPFPEKEARCRDGSVRKSERLGGLLNFYHRAAA